VTVSQTGGQLVVQALASEGVRAVFTVPGESFLPVLDALYEHRTQIETVSHRHESSAGFAADGYSKASGQVGVCLVTRGVGSRNLAIALHTAFQDSTPLVALVGQVPTNVRHREAFQEVDLDRVFGAMTKRAFEVTRTDRIPELLQQAFRIARSGRPGPVVVALPEDVLFGSAEARSAPAVHPSKPRPDAASVYRSAELLLAAEAPMVLAGREVLTDGATSRLVRLADELSLPVMNAFRRCDAFPNDDRHFAGSLAPGMPTTAVAPLETADLVLALGVRFTEFTTQRYRYPLQDTQLIHVTSAGDMVGEWGSPTLPLVSSADAFLDDLFAALAGRSAATNVRSEREAAVDRHRSTYLRHATCDEAFEQPGTGTRISRVIAALQRHAPATTAIVTDVGNFSMWVPRYYRFSVPGTHFGAISGAMGYALPAAVGIAKHAADRPVVVIAGDGGFAMTMSELSTVRQHDLPVLTIVLVNDAYGTIRMHQQRHYPGRPIATDLLNPSFQRIAEAYGIPAASVCGDEEFEQALVTHLQTGGPALIEVHLGQERGAAWSDVG